MITISIITVYVIVVGSWIFYELKNAPAGYQEEGQGTWEKGPETGEGK